VNVFLLTYHETGHSESAMKAVEKNPDHGTFDVLKHVGDLLMSDEHILHMQSLLHKLN
jgi:hypothetical protein